VDAEGSKIVSVSESKPSGSTLDSILAFPDEYRRRARLKPAILEILPILLVLGLGAFSALGGQNAISRVGVAGMAAILSALGLTSLLEQFGRDQGKRKELQLWAKWGGAPTTQMLRHRDRQFCNPVTRVLYHQKLQALVPGLQVPTPAAETSDPIKADLVYDAYTKFLIAKTRDRQRFPLVFEENINYGFRRNLWGTRPAGLLLSLLGTCVAAVGLFATWAAENPIFAAWAAVLILNASFVAWWSIRINADWVFIPAKAYAERLMEAIDSL
jgi:hypothetical protein